jgi:hypothetical protein
MVRHGWGRILIQKVGRIANGPEVGVFALNIALPIGPKDRTPLSKSEEYLFGQEAWVLGFPLGLSSEKTNGEYPDPLLTHGYLAGRASATSFYLDYHNNVGSSGSPVFVRNKAGRLRLLGVVTSYQYAPLAGDREQRYAENSGIAIVTDVTSIYQLIDANPIGYKLR